MQARTLPIAWVPAMVDYGQRFAKAAMSEVRICIIQVTKDGTVDWRKNLPLIKQKIPASHADLLDEARTHLVNESVSFREPLFAKLAEIVGP